MHLQIIDAVVKGILLGLFMAISVGPTLFAVIQYSLESGMKAGLAFVLGVSLSDIIYVTLANVAASLLVLLQSYNTQIAIGGAAILLAVGILGVLKKKTKSLNVNKIAVTKGRFFKIFLGGFLINSINPGVIISWLTAVTATANKTVLYRFILFGTCLVLVLSVDFCKVFLANTIKKKLTVNSVFILQKTSAIIIIVLGLLLLFTTLFKVQF